MLALALALSYLLGAIPSGYLLVRWVKRMDVRAAGSGNIGATNVLRTAGPSAGAAVLVFDIAKGWVAARLIPGWLMGAPGPFTALACGTAAVLGHVFPCFLNFRGGKGVATTLGALTGSDPTVALIVVGTWLGVFAACRYVSVGSLAAAAAIPISQALWHRTLGELVLGALLAVVMVLRHRDNIRRLVTGAEHRAWSSHRST